MQNSSPCTSLAPLSFILNIAARVFFMKANSIMSFSPSEKNKSSHHEQKAFKGFPCLQEPCPSLQTHFMPSSPLAAHCALVTLSFLFYSPSNMPSQGLYTCCNIVILLHSFITGVCLTLVSLFSV